MIRSLYRGATWLAAPLLRRHLARRLPQGKEEAERIGERYGKASLARPRRAPWLAAWRQRRRDPIAAAPDRRADRAPARSHFARHHRHGDLGAAAGPAPAAAHAASISAPRPPGLGRTFPRSLAPGFRALGRIRALAQSPGRGEPARHSLGAGERTSLGPLPVALGAGRLAHPAAARGLPRGAGPGSGPGGAPRQPGGEEPAMPRQSEIRRRSFARR